MQNNAEGSPTVCWGNPRQALATGYDRIDALGGPPTL